MMRIFLIFCFLWIGTGLLRAQLSVLSDTIYFSGVVLHGETAKPLPDVTCRQGAGRGTVSDGEGCFRMQLQRGDSVIFTHVGFRTCVVVVPDSLDGDEYMVGVFMSPDTLQLSDVLIVRRWGESKQQQMVNVRNNMRGILKQAYDPNRPMDAGMNQRMMIDEYARRVEMKGHVDVRLGIGTHSLDAFRLLKLQQKVRDSRDILSSGEVDLLKKIYYSEKRRKMVD